MSNCPNFRFCVSLTHTIPECHAVMSDYYGVCIGDLRYFICSYCKRLELRSFASFAAAHREHFQVLPQAEKDRITSRFLFKMSRRLGPVSLNVVPVPVPVSLNVVPVPVSFQIPITSLVSVSNNILPSIPVDISDSSSGSSISSSSSSNHSPYVSPVHSVVQQGLGVIIQPHTTVPSNPGPSNPGTSSRKRSITTNVVVRPKKRRNCPEIESDVNSSHMILRLDVTEYDSIDIIVPDCMVDAMQNQFNRMQGAKVQFGITAQFTKDDGEIKEWSLSNKAVVLDSNFIEQGINILNSKIENYTQLASNWRLLRITELVMTMTKFRDIIHRSGSSYIVTPQELIKTKSIINVKNEDNLCFLYSILAVQKYNEIFGHNDRVAKYTPYLNTLEFKNEWFPMKLIDIPKFEKLNPTFGVNVFVFKSDYNNGEIQYKNPNVDLVYKSRNEGPQIYLVLIEENNNYHYIGVSNLDSLMNYRNNGIRIQSKWCPICLHGFRKQKRFDDHVALCKKNVEPTTLYKMPTKKEVKFQDWSKTIRKEYVIYADFESILPTHIKFHQKHEPIGAGAVLLKNGIVEEYKDWIGADCVINFLEWVQKVSDEKVFPWYETHGKVAMNPLTPEEQRKFQFSTRCYLCKEYSKKLVRDHDHFSGQYIGAACNKCNLSRRNKPTLQVVFHNLKGYDMHHILKYAIGKFPNWDLKPIPNSTEKFLALIVHFNEHSIRFIDSYAFLISSLAKLVDNMSSLPLTETQFDTSLMDAKGIFPYDFATSHQVLRDTKELPPKWNNITDVEYEKAKLVWRVHGCECLQDYMQVYLKLDVFLLADVFERFRIKSMEEDGLEPLAFFGIPGMSWASAIKMLKHNVELIQDDEMYRFFEGGIRGGITFINRHHAKTTLKEALLYVDINNLYGWALSQKLPYSKFEWVDDIEEIRKIIQLVKDNHLDGDTGYSLEVDLHVPNSIMDKLDDLPIAPVLECPPNSKVPKLLLTHKDKLNYVVHSKLLSFWLSLGVQLIKVHRVVKYQQAPVFADYVKLNTEKRALSTNKFDKDFYKLKNNSLYGKTVENLKKRLNLRIVNNDETRLVTYTSSPYFRRSMKIDDNLIGVLLNKEEIVLDRPSYIGQTVLDLSKLRMYQLQYQDLEKYRQEFNCEIKIVAGDTDSFFLKCKNVDLDQLLKKMQDDGQLDTSNYPADHPLYSTTVENKLGLYKDEACGKRFKEWIFLRPKCYSLKYRNNKEVLKAKGVNVKGTTLKHKNYKVVYKYNLVQSIPQTRFITRNHQLYTQKNTKVALKCLDDKRIWTAKNRSVAYGHWSVKT